MDFDVPTDLINRAQIGFREGVGLSSFHPEDTTLPSLPTVEASISTLESSPSYLRCKFCKGKLLRGLQSLICIYCGENQKKDLHPDPISFNSSNGYRWLLQSLNLNGSERVGALAEGSGIHGGQSPTGDEVTLSDLLDLQISWQDKPKKPENSFDNKTSEHGSSLNVGTADLDNFFIESKRAIISDNASEEQPVTSKRDQNKAFGGQENLTLFQNVLPLETSATSSIDVSDDASSGWNAEFQSADIKMEDENSKSADPFVGAEADLSVHMDAVFGQMEGLNSTKLNDDSDTVPSTGKDWIEDDLFGNMRSASLKQAEQLESVVEAKDRQNDIYSEGIDGDWFSDGIWQTSSANNAAVIQQDDLLDLVAKHNEKSSQDNPNDSFTEGVSIDWFENTNWPKSTANINNTTTSKDEDSFDIKPRVDAVSSPSLVNDLIQNDLLYNASSQISSHTERSDFDNSNKHYSDTTDWFQDSQWPFGASSATTTTMAASKDDDTLDEWDDFTSSTGNQGSFPDSWKQSSNENVTASKKISELDLFPSTMDPQEVDFGNFSQSDLFSGSSSNKNPNDTQEVYDIFPEASTASRKNSSNGKKENVEMVLSQMHDLSFMLKSELSVPSKPQGSS